MVNSRAISRFTCRTWLVSSNWRVAKRSRSFINSCFELSSRSARSWSAIPRISVILSIGLLASCQQFLAYDELRLDGQLEGSQTHRIACGIFAHAGNLEDHAPRLDHRDPMVDGAFTAAHARFCGLL